MTSNERLVWAAAFAGHYLEGYRLEQTRGVKHSVPEAVEWAWSAVAEMREALPAVERGWGLDDEVYRMLQEMTS